MIGVHAYVGGPIVSRGAVIPVGYTEVMTVYRVFVLPCKFVNMWEKSKTYARCSFSANRDGLYCNVHHATIERYACLRREPSE